MTGLPQDFLPEESFSFIKTTGDPYGEERQFETVLRSTSTTCSDDKRAIGICGLANVDFRMAPLCCEEKSHHLMTREDTFADPSIENAKQDLKIEGQQSTPVMRRVIFPSLHPERFQKAKEQRKDKADKSTPPSPDSVSSVTIEDERRSMVPLFVFPIRSPGLHATKHNPRIMEELDLQVSHMSLTDTTSDVPPPPPLMPKPRLLRPQVIPKQVSPAPTEPVARSVSLGAPPVRRNRIDRNHYAARLDSFLPPRKEPYKPKPLPSILKPSKFLGSVPSLVPVDNESNSSSETLMSLNSHSKSAISFDPCVRVIEYIRSQEEIERTWFSQDELDHFRKQTIARLVAHNTELLPSGTGFVVQRTIPSKAVFAYPIMGSSSEDDDESHVEYAVNREIQNVLIVDPYDICLKLFARDFKRMIPDVNVCAARSGEEAMKLIAGSYRFDIFIVEERLKLFHRHARVPAKELSSGSEFIKTLSREKGDKCLFIAVSAHLDKDKQAIEKSGADFIWAKPPPEMDEIMRDVLLKALLVKRGKHSEADKLFGGIMKSP